MTPLLLSPAPDGVTIQYWNTGRSAPDKSGVLTCFHDEGIPFHPFPG